MNKLLIISILCLFSEITFGQNSVAFYKHFKGKIDGKYEIVMDLNRDGEILFGSYYYTKHKTAISLTGKILADGSIKLSEYYVLSGESTGSFTGTLTANKFTGNWKNAKQTISLPFSLSEDYSDCMAFKSYAFEDKKALRKNKPSESASADLTLHYLCPINHKNKAVEVKIKEILNEHIFGNKTPKGSSPDEYITNFQKNYFAEYYNNFVDVSDEEKQSYIYNQSFDKKINIILNTNELLTIEITKYEYRGGAHGMTSGFHEIYDLRTGNQLKISDLIINGKENELNKILNQELRKKEGISEQEDLTNYNYFESKITFNKNYYIDRSGLGFLYNPYEIAPYAMGFTEIYIPFSKLGGILKTDGIIGRLLK